MPFRCSRQARCRPIHILLRVAGAGLPFLCATVRGQTNCVPPPPGLVSWWSFEGNAEDRVSGNTGTLHGAIRFVPGKVGKAISFDDARAGISLAMPTNLLLQDFTIESWIKRTSDSQVSWNG